MATVKLDEKIVEKLRAANAAAATASGNLSAATMARMDAEARERQAAEEFFRTSREFRAIGREAALRAGLDPDKPFAIDIVSGIIEEK